MSAPENLSLFADKKGMGNGFDPERPAESSAAVGGDGITHGLPFLELRHGALVFVRETEEGESFSAELSVQLVEVRD